VLSVVYLLWANIYYQTARATALVIPAMTQHTLRFQQ